MKHFKLATAAVIGLLAAGVFATSASADAYGDCKAHALQKFGWGVATLDFGQQKSAIDDQAGCRALMTPQDVRDSAGFDHALWRMHYTDNMLHKTVQ
jgi:hypothetical protein